LERVHWQIVGICPWWRIGVVVGLVAGKGDNGQTGIDKWHLVAVTRRIILDVYVAHLVDAKDGLGDILIVAVIIVERLIADSLKLRKDGRDSLLPQRAKTDDVLALSRRKVDSAWISCIVLQWRDINIVWKKRIGQLWE